MIKSPIEAVFDRLIDIDNYNEWLPQQGIFISTRQVSEGSVQFGTRYEDKTRFGTFRGEVIKFEPPTRVVFRHHLRWLGLPILETRPGYSLKSSNGGTRIHHTADGQLFGLFKLMQPGVERIARAERQRTVNALKQSLEHE